MIHSRISRAFIFSAALLVGLSSGCGLAIRRLASTTCDPSASPYGGGNGSTASPYLICSVDQLEAVADRLDGSFRLASDLDLSGATGFPLGGDDSDVFTGSLDGAGYSLSGLVLSDPSGSSSAGLFRFFGGTLSNVTLEDFDVSGNDYVGAIAGHGTTSRFDGVTLNRIKVRGRGFVGGAFGRLEGEGANGPAWFSNFRAEDVDVSSSFDGAIMNHNAPAFDRDAGVGALVGSQDNENGSGFASVPQLRVSDSTFKNLVSGTTATAGSLVSSDYAHVGGVVGLAIDGYFSDVTVTGVSVTGVGVAGALVGYKDYGPTAVEGSAPANLFVDVTVTGATVNHTNRTGWSVAGGFFGSGNNFIAKRVVFVGSLVTHGNSAGGFSGDGCGANIDGAYVDVTLTQDSGAYVGGILGGDCVATVKNSVVLGTLAAGGSYVGSVSGTTYSNRTYGSVLSLMSSITNIAGGIANTRPALGRANGATTVAGLYHWDALNAGLTADAYSTSRSAAQIASIANFPEFDFAGSTWTMATSIPHYSGVAPIPSFACGKVSGLVCP